MMFRSAILIVLIAPFVSAQSDPCLELVEKLSACLITNIGATASQPSDGVACNTCFTDNNFEDLYNRTTATCDDANSKVCELLNTCKDDCFLKVDVCQQEYDDVFACSFGSGYAPTGCLVQCDSNGSNGGTSGETDGGNSNNVNGTNAGSNGSSNAGSVMHTISLETSSMLFVAIVVGYLL